MDNFLLLTVLAGIIGLFTIQPEYKKLRIAYNGYSFGNPDKIIIAALIIELLFLIIFGSFISYHTPNANITINYTETFPFISILYSFTSLLYPFISILYPFTSLLYTFNFILFCIAHINYSYKYMFLTDMANIAAIISIFLFFFDKFYTRKIKIYNKINFLDKWDELFYKKEYNTLILLTKDNYANIMNFEKYNDHNKLLLQMAENSIRKQRGLPILENNSDYNVDNEFLNNIEMRLLDYNFVKQLVKFDPYFGIRIVTDKDVDAGFREEFAQLYFKELIINRNSVLYREIRYTQSIKKNRYEISKNNKIIHQILSDIKNADENEIYSPIGKSILDILDKQAQKDRDRYNEYNSNLMPFAKENFRDPLIMVVHFFDIMIREALYQGIKWHMFLHYYSYFVEKISKNYRITEHSKTGYEFPNVYSAILWQIFHNLIDWIELINKDIENLSLELEDTICNVQNDNIIKNSIFVLVECVQSVIDGKNIPNKDLIGNVLELYSILAMSKSQETQRYGKVLKCCLLDLASKKQEYRDYLVRTIDYVLDPLATTIKIQPRGYKVLRDLRKQIEH